MNIPEIVINNPATLVPILNVVGYAVKNFIPQVKNEWIPAILIVSGTAAQIPYLDPISTAGVMSAVATAASAIGIHQLYKVTEDLIKKS